MGVTAGAGLRLPPRVAVVVELTRAALPEGPQQVRVFSSSEEPAYSDPLVDTVPAGGAGLDVRLRIARNVNLVPSLRVHLLLDYDTADGQPPLRGMSRVLATAAVGIRVVF